VDDLLKDPENAEWTSLSIEFCGGTHLTNTKGNFPLYSLSLSSSPTPFPFISLLTSSPEAVAFAIVAEESLAAGVRRIVAVTGKEAQSAIANALELRGRVSFLFFIFFILF
jgi:alanyl-tRNA synthetase